MSKRDKMHGRLLSDEEARDVRARLFGEPQDVAPSVGSSAGTGTAGVPSCDSELVAWKRLIESPDAEYCSCETLLEGGRFLLRMVEELTADIAKRDKWNTKLILERDDLRANLETAEHNSKSWEMAAKEWGDKCDDLRAKLAETEQRAANTVARADANEVRAQQLEAKLAEADALCLQRFYELDTERAKVNALHSDLLTAGKRASELEQVGLDYRRACENWRKRTKVAESKLAEADQWEDLQSWRDRCHGAERRAEAAEARCRKAEEERDNYANLLGVAIGRCEELEGR